MYLFGILVWFTTVAISYTMVIMMFTTQQMHPLMRRIAIGLSVTFLTVRIIRTEMTPMDPMPVWADTPLAQSIFISLFFGILADIGLPSLIIVGMMVIAIDATWIADTIAERAGLLY